jgi:uncharacterized spore protein YtfJ
MSNNVVEVLKGVVGELREIAKSESIIGEAITVGDKTVIPVIKVSVGFGAGGGQGESEKVGGGFGGGGGGGAKIEPSAFIVMDAKGVKILGTGKGKWEAMIDLIPEITRKVKDLAGKMKSDDEDSEKEAETEE